MHFRHNLHSGCELGAVCVCNEFLVTSLPQHSEGQRARRAVAASQPARTRIWVGRFRGVGAHLRHSDGHDIG